MASTLLRTKTILCFFLIALSLIAWRPSLAELKVSKSKLSVTDTRSNLMWVRNANLAGQTMTWQEAKDWAARLEYDGYRDWRLPSAENPDGTVCFTGSTEDCSETEFGRLFVDEGILQDPSAPFQNISNVSYYWTSSESPNDASMAMVFNFGVAAVGSVGSPTDIFKTSSNTSIPWAVRSNSRWEELIATYGWFIAVLLAGAGALVFFWIFRKRKQGVP